MDTDGFRKALLDQGEVRQEVDRQQDRRQPRTPSATTDKAFLLSSTEVYGDLQSDGTQYEYYKSKDVTSSNYSGASSSFYRWTRSVAQFGDKEFRCIFGEMGWGLCDARGTNCVLPAFCF